MDISSVASQALAVKENLSQSQLGIAAVRQVADAQRQMADMLAKNAAVVPPASTAEKGGFSTYA